MPDKHSWWATPWAEIYFIFKARTYHYQLVFRRAFGVRVFVRHLFITLPGFPVTMNSVCYRHYHCDIILDPNYDCVILWWCGVFLLCIGRMWIQNQNQYASWKANSQRNKMHVHIADMTVLGTWILLSKIKNILLDIVMIWLFLCSVYNFIFFLDFCF